MYYGATVSVYLAGA